MNVRALHTAAIVLLAAAVARPEAQQPPGQVARDQIQRAPAGTAVVSGIVTTDEPSPSPIRRARVALVNSDFVSLSATTDDAGRFVITGVPGGTYSAQATKSAWLFSEYGASKPGRGGTPIVVRDGDRVQNIAIRMSRGAVVSGTISGRSGQPLPYVDVQVLRRSISPVTGDLQYGMSSANAVATTDDEGNYRVFGLSPGTYVIVATLRSTTGPAASLLDLDRQTAEDVTRIIADTASNQAASNRPAPPRLLAGFAPTYFPGAADPAQLIEFRLGAGEERSGMNMVLEPVTTAAIAAVIPLPSGLDPASLQVTLTPDNAVAASTSQSGRPGRRDADGRYLFPGLSPGTYTLLARAGTSRETLTHYASARMAIDGRDQNVPLELAPGMTVAGRAVFEGDASRPRDLSGNSILLMPFNSGPGLTGPRGTIDGDGAFRIAGVPAGRYRVLFLGGASKQGWHLRTARAGAVDALEDGLTVSPGADVTLTLTYASTPSELKGQLQLSSGRPALDYTLIVFSDDRRYWKPASSRVRQLKPSSDGSYSFVNLAAGDYFLAAVTDIDPSEPLDAEFLAQLVPAAVKVRIADATATVQNLQIK